MACTWASAFSPEKSSQIFWRAFCGGSVLARSQAARSPTATMGASRNKATMRLCLVRRQSESAEDALQVIVAIILNLNASTLFPVMERYPRAEMFLQPALQVTYGRTRGNSLPPAARAGRAELARHETLGRADGRA